MNDYAIMRTRFQPLHVGHLWAIERFFEECKPSCKPCRLASRILVAAVVDPTLLVTPEARKLRPRFNPDFNPFRHWDVVKMARSQVCALGSPRCSRVLLTHIPPFAALQARDAKLRSKEAELQGASRPTGEPKGRATRHHKDPLRAFEDRLPLSAQDRTVWYFPVFDEEDVLDIELLWHLMARKELPTHPVMILQSEDYAYRIEHASADREPVYGIHAAALAELLGLGDKKRTDANPLIPDKAMELVNSLPPAFRTRVQEMRSHIANTLGHDLFRHHHFRVPSIALYDYLWNKFHEAFRERGEQWCGPKWQQLVHFIPPRPESRSLHCVIQQAGANVRTVLGGSPPKRGTLAALLKEIDRPYCPPHGQLLQIGDTLVQECRALAQENRHTRQRLTAIADGVVEAINGNMT